ncbi:MAG: glycosyltransferase, partial [Acidimicrobiales bacterium]
MARILVVVPPFAGHVNPTVTLGAELARRGHEVAWAGPAAGVAQLLIDGQTLYDTNPEIDRDALAAMVAANAGQRGLIAFKGLWEQVLLPLAGTMLDGVERAVHAFAPHLVIADQQAFAGAVVATRRGLPWVSSATTSAEMTDPLSELPRVRERIREALVAFQRMAGIPREVAANTDPRCSPLLTVAFTTRQLVGPRLAWPNPVCFVGPAMADRVELDDFPWEWLDEERHLVLVTLG